MRSYISNTIDSTLNDVVKWPLAIILLYFFQDIFYSFLKSFQLLLTLQSITFLIGALLFFFLGFKLNYRSKAERFLTFEHELAHAIFCFLTFKSNIKIKMNPAEEGVAGLCEYSGGSNWLITLAPYFFPTLTVFISCLYFLPLPLITPLLDVCVGYSIAYHLKTNYVEFSNAIVSKRETSDLVKVGKLYSCIIIPIFNLIVFSIIFGVIS